MMLSNNSYTVGEFLNELTNALLPISEDLADRDAETIIEHLLGFNYSQIRIKKESLVDDQTIQKARAIVTERLTGKPLPYVLGTTFFYNKEFLLSDETLIPRHDTEHLVAHILENEAASDHCFFLELGTGSGIIPEVLTIESPNWRGISVDINESSQGIARKNCSDKITLLLSDSFSAIKADKQFDFIVSNPPYIPQTVVENDLDDSVRFFEPHRALAGGEDGLDFYRYLAEVSESYLRDGGHLYLEIGYDQGESVPALLKEVGACDIKVINDFGNRPRVVACKF